MKLALTQSLYFDTFAPIKIFCDKPKYMILFETSTMWLLTIDEKRARVYEELVNALRDDQIARKVLDHHPCASVEVRVLGKDVPVVEGAIVIGEPFDVISGWQQVSPVDFYDAAVRIVLSSYAKRLWNSLVDHEVTSALFDLRILHGFYFNLFDGKSD